MKITCKYMVFDTTIICTLCTHPDKTSNFCTTNWYNNICPNEGGYIVGNI